MRLFSIGDRVSQPQYGPGTVAAINEFHTTVNFDDRVLRTFATSIVKLERSSTVAPPALKRARASVKGRVAKTRAR
ncbi:MAG: hypothetical protein HOP16_17605 [Acidobacteria bacterium]|nr:hypothetical protein [Acidobacteriota bacterium]